MGNVTKFSDHLKSECTEHLYSLRKDISEPDSERYEGALIVLQDTTVDEVIFFKNTWYLEQLL